MLLGMSALTASALDTLPGVPKQSDTYWADRALSAAKVKVQNAETTASNSEVFYTGKLLDADSGTYAFMYRNYDPELGRWTSSDPSGFPDGANGQYYAPVPTSMVDWQGLYAILTLTQTWTSHTSWYYRATLNDSLNPGEVSFNANAGTNTASVTQGDPYGTNGPIPGGTYDLVPRTDWAEGDTYENGTPSITGPGQNPGSITTPNGTNRSNLYVHGAGTSNGCVASDQAGLIRQTMDANLEHGGMQIRIINTPAPE